MAFSKKTWLQRIVEHPSRRRLNETGTHTVYDVSRAEGDVIQEGDGFTVKNMNDLEERISRAFEEQGYYGTCNTAAATAAKTATIDGFVLEEGSRVLLKMQTNNSAGSPTLNINNTGAKPISVPGGTPNIYWSAGIVLEFVYDGTYWCYLKEGIGNASSYGITRLSDTYATKIANGAAVNGIGASQNALYNAYNTINNMLTNIFPDIINSECNASFYVNNWAFSTEVPLLRADLYNITLKSIILVGSSGTAFADAGAYNIYNHKTGFSLGSGNVNEVYRMSNLFPNSIWGIAFTATKIK